MPFANAQNLKFQNWNEVADSICKGNEEAAILLFDIKKRAEKMPIWDDNMRQVYSAAISLLTEFTSNNGLYKEEEAILKDAMHQFNERDEIANSPYTRQLWVSMTKLQKDLGDPNAILQYGAQALRMFEEAQDYGYDYALLLHNIALGYLMNKNLLPAKLYIDEAICICETLIEKKEIPIEWGYVLKNAHGMIETELRHYDSAILDFKNVLKLTESTDFMQFHTLAANNLSVIYIKLGKYKEAKDILASLDSSSYEVNIYKYQNTILLDYLLNNLSDIEDTLIKYNYNAYNRTNNIISAFSETEREAYLKENNAELIFVNNLASFKNNKLSEIGFDNNLYARSLSMAVNIAMQTEVNEYITDGDTIVSQLNKLRNAYLSKTISAIQRDSIHREIIEQEKFLLRNNPEISNRINYIIGNWKEIQTNLKKGDAVVMFCYLPELCSPDSVTAYYGAYVTLPHSTRPHLVKLCEIDTVEDIFYNLNPSTEFISELYTPDKAHTLYKLLWEPLKNYLKDSYNIYYSTCGPLSMINHEALVDCENSPQGFTKNMIYLSTPSVISSKNFTNSSQRINDIILYGSPEFDLPVAKMQEGSLSYNNFSGSNKTNETAALRGDLMRDGWQHLPATQTEVDNIYKLLKNQKVDVKKYLGEYASEEAVKALSGNSPQILHIATHGFVISTQTQYNNSAFAQSMSGINEKDSYMLWSGLVLTGGNNAWLGKEIPENVEDGILTAEEISRLDLSNTKLVVLSACDTGRGHIDPVEGVWGLQRAFKEAGVESILMTLWKVPDSTTAMFMEKFYTQLLKGRSIRQAVKDAQQYLIKNGASDPFYWAPFVVLD